MEMMEILKKGAESNASDVHLVIGKPPMARIRGSIKPLDDTWAPISAEESKRLVYSILLEDQRRKLEEEWELDCSIALTGVSRFRVNVLIQRAGVEAVFRVISATVPSPESLRISSAIMALADLARGLVLVTGPTGSGKSTTLACMLNSINENRREHILTIEDPIEFVYESKNCIIRQREVGQQTKSFGHALKHALRQDPDVILVGELRDLETISLALTAAETGHLVFATLHTTDAPATIDRIIDVFPSHQQQQIRTQLSSVLKGVVCQTLIPSTDGRGRVAAREVMVVTPAVSNLIREGKTHQLYGAIDTGSKLGMVSLDRALLDLVRQGLVTQEDAIAKANNPDFIRGGGHGSGPATTHR